MAHQLSMDELILFAEDHRRKAEIAEKTGRPRVARELLALAQRAERMIQSAAERYFVQTV